MLYARISRDGTVLKFPVPEDELRKILSNVILPKVITEESLQDTGFVMVPLSADTVIPLNTKDKMTRLADVELVDGKYKRKYESVDVPTYMFKNRLSRRWNVVRLERQRRMNAVEWRICRWNREMRLGLTPTDDIKKLDTYMQALAEVTKQDDPFLIVWPTLE
jgi:hypothetical protein